jgi:plastocyanin
METSTMQSSQTKARRLLALAFGAALLPLAATPAAAETREFYIVTVHIDGKTSIKGDDTHPPEPFPSEPFAQSGGMWVKGPAENGEWQARVFVFDPAQVTVRAGDEVRLHFMGVQGVKHHVSVEGVDGAAEVSRGTMRTISFTAKEPGIVRFSCADHGPSMQGQVVVLP